MTIDRAIKREQAKAEEYRAMSSEGNAEIAEINIRCSKYHEQLAEWLEELKEYKANNHPKCEDCAGCTAWKCDCSNVRNMAIDDFAEKVKEIYPFTILELEELDEVAEQLKEGSADNE